MKWITHQTGAALAGMALQLPPAAVAAACFGAIAPDVVDQKISRLGPRKSRQRVFNQIHRGNSHWFGWWLALFLLPLAQPLSLPADVLGGLGFGALTHIGLDMLTPQGVPWLPFTRSNRVGFGLCRTGKISEWLFLAAMAGSALFYMGPVLWEKLK